MRALWTGLALMAFGAAANAQLAGCSPEDLEAMFRRGKAEAIPVGPAKGKILHHFAAKMPRLKIAVQQAMWKGKVFHADGSFVNQWAGFKAIRSQAAIAPSWLDGKPCLVLEYEKGTPVFGNTRDELREVAPGVWLGRFHARCPCGALEGWFVLTMRCCGE